MSLSTCEGFHGLITAHGHHLLLQPEEKDGTHFVMSVGNMLQNYFPEGINGKFKKLREQQETKVTHLSSCQKKGVVKFL